MALKIIKEMATMGKKTATFRQLFIRLKLFLKSSQFIILTVMGNLFIFAVSILFYFIEKDVNPAINAWMDSIWWSFTTVTAVGYGDVVPASLGGRIIGIGLMLVGTALFATYTAIFANAILGREFMEIDKKMKVIHKDFQGLKEEVMEEEEVLQILAKLKGQIERLENHINKEES